MSPTGRLKYSILATARSNSVKKKQQVVRIRLATARPNYLVVGSHNQCSNRAS
jgi:hypothetical protein